MSKSEFIYYVYILFDWRGIPRYVGKGRGNRWLNHERTPDPSNWRKNEFIEQTWIMLGEIPKIKVCEYLLNKEACIIEIAFIAAIGRLDLGTGPLTNMTIGGDGISGINPAILKRRGIAIRAAHAADPTIGQRISHSLKAAHAADPSITERQIALRKANYAADPLKEERRIAAVKAAFTADPTIMKQAVAKRKITLTADPTILERQIASFRNTLKANPSIIERRIVKYKETCSKRKAIKQNNS